MKDFSFKKLWNDIKGLFKSKNSKGVKDATNAVAGDTEAKAALDAKRHATYSKTEAANEAHRYHAKNAETINLTEAERKAGIADAEAAFKGYDPVKFKKGQVLENAGLTQEQYKIVKKHANPEKVVKFTEKEKAVLPKWIQDSETCQRYANSIEAQFAKIDEMFPKAVPAKK